MSNTNASKTAGKENHGVRRNEDSLRSIHSKQQHSSTFQPPKTRNVLALFRSEAKRTPRAGFWDAFETLAECVVDASLSMPAATKSGKILLEENSVELLNVCRKLIKEAREVKDPALALSYLCVGVHGVRAIGLGFSAGSKEQDLSLKILYYAILRAESVFSQAESPEIKQRAGCYALAAYEALGHLFRRYSLLSTTTGGERIKFGWPDDKNERLIIFPVPKKTGSGTALGGIPVEQVLAIGVQSTIAVSRVFASKVWCGREATPLEFGGRVLSLLERAQTSEMALGEIVLHLTRKVAEQWISVLVSEGGKECANDVVSNCKQIYRVLCDYGSGAAETKIAADECLLFRREAIAALLGGNAALKTAPEIHSMLMARHFEQACNCAWKAAASFVRQKSLSCPLASPHPLYIFHDIVGGLLDSCSTGDCFPYKEYCAYRALHTGVCGTTSKPDRWLELHARGSFDQVLITLFCLGIKVRDQLVGRETEQTFDILGCGTRIVDRFRSVFIGGTDCIDAGRNLRWFELLSMLSLDRVVYETLQANPVRPGIDNGTLELVGRILSGCIGPLACKLVAAGDLHKRRLPHIWDTAVSCFLRAISVFERLASMSKVDRDAKKKELPANYADEAMGELVDNLTAPKNRMKPPSASVITAAKFLSNVGKQREKRDEKAKAIPPLLYSLLLFMYLSRDDSAESMADHELSARWAFLATVYRSLSLKEEAIIATVSALLLDAIEASCRAHNSERDFFLELFHALGSLTNGVVNTGFTEEERISRARQGLIAKLVIMFSQREQSDFVQSDSSKLSAFSPMLAVDTLLKSAKNRSHAASTLFVERSGIAFSLCGILQVMFTKNALPPNYGRGQDGILVEKTKILAEIVANLGASLQRETSAKSCGSVSISDFNYICRLATSYIRKITCEGGEEAKQVVSAVFDVAASVSLCKRSMDLNNWSLESHDLMMQGMNRMGLLFDLAEKYASRACDSLLQVAGNADDWQLVSGALRPALQLFRAQLIFVQGQNEGIDSYRNSLKHLRSIVEFLEEETSPSPLVQATRRCLTAVLSRLSDFFSLEGEDLHALQLATWNRETSRVDGRSFHPWFEAAALSLIADGVTISSSTANVDEDSPPLQPAHVENLASRLRLMVLGVVEKTGFASPEERLASLLVQLESQLTATPTESNSSTYLLRWSKTTVLLGLSEAAERIGNLEASLSRLELCSRECRSIASALGKDKNTATASSKIETSFWERVVMLTIPVRCAERQIDCLVRSTLLLGRLGDRRGALRCAESAIRTAGLDLVEAFGRNASFVDYFHHLSLNRCRRSQEMRLRRLFLQAKAQASPQDVVFKAFQDDAENRTLSPVQSPSWSDGINTNRLFEEIDDLVQVGDLLGGQCPFLASDDIRGIYLSARSRFETLVQTSQFASLLQTFEPQCYCAPGRLLPQIDYETRLRAAITHHPLGVEEAVPDDLTEIAEALDAPPRCRALALYNLGLIALRRAKKASSLDALWSADCETTSEEHDTCPFIRQARSYFAASLALLGPASDILTRDALRCLALVSGPDQTRNIGPTSSSMLIHASIGSGIRQHIVRALGGIQFPIDDHPDEPFLNEARTSYPIETIFRALDSKFGGEGHAQAVESFLCELGKRIPRDWRFVAVALCPTGELLLTSIESTDSGEEMEFSTTCVMPNSGADRGFPYTAYDEIMKPLDSIIQRSQGQLQGVDSAAMNESLDDDSKREWWRSRKTLDEELQDLLYTVEQKYFRSERARTILHGHAHVEDENDSICASRNLASRFEAISLADDSEWKFHETDPQTMKVAELKEELVGYGMELRSLRSMRKAELVAMVISKRRSGASSSVRPGATQGRPAEGGPSCSACTFLILDENLQRFPFESMVSFEGRTVSRLPSLPFALAKLAEASIGVADLPTVASTRSLRYILDPEANLAGTKDRLLPFLESMNRSGGGHWKGVVGATPTADFIEDGLTAEDGLLLYFGHGGGQLYFSRSQIERLIRPKKLSPSASTRRGQSSVILMGCSSARLISVNRKNTQSLEQFPIYFEPEGVALSYLLAGAPFVVGNLWDVTDHDIDRFSITMLDKFLNGEDCPSIANCVGEARSACKMRYIVGCAPVCYGLPLCRRESST